MLFKFFSVATVLTFLGFQSAIAASSAPIAPSSLRATTVSSTQINLQWQDSSSNELGFIIQRSLSSTNGFVQIANVSANTMSFTSTSLSPATTYYYRVAAYNKARGQYSYSTFSIVASATTAPASSTTTTTLPPPTTTTTVPPTTTNSISLNVAGAPNLPYNGTSTLVTVGFVGATPASVSLARDGLSAFATWPGGTFFTLSSDGKSISGNWCISASCWGYQSGSHFLTAIATYADGSTKSSTVTLNVVDTTPTTILPPTTTTLPPPPTTTTLPPPSAGPTYYVAPFGNDLNAGTFSAPWRTIQKAANTVSAGATVILMDGTYEEPSINVARSGTATAPITFKAQHKWMAIVSSYSGCNPALSVNASYITLKDFRITTSSRNVNCTVYSSANVDIRAWNTRLATPTNPTTGTAGFIASGMKLDGLYRDVAVKSNQDYSIIENSESNNLIELFGNKDSIVRKNVITGQDRFGNSIVVKGGVRNVQIYENLIHARTGGPGIIIGGSSCDTCAFDSVERVEAYNTVAYNNVVINQSSGLMPALVFQGAKDSAFINNIVINGSLAMLVGGQAPTYRFPTTNPTFKNNIVICNGGPLTTLNFGWSYAGTMNMDYNNFYNCTGSLAQVHPIVGNPMFVNPMSDWRLQPGSPAINSGVPVTMPAYGGGFLDISRDFNGTVRTTPWDLGIYNVTP